VPRAFYDLLTLDFQTGGKTCTGGFCRMPNSTGQYLPVKGKFLPGGGNFCRVFELKKTRKS
jgi:hypothetical protein